LHLSVTETRTERISRPQESRNGSRVGFIWWRLATFHAGLGAESRAYIHKGGSEVSEWDQEGQGGGATEEGGGMGGGSEEGGGMGGSDGESGGDGGDMGGGGEEGGGMGGES
jgi:hypothetical protein